MRKSLAAQNAACDAVVDLIDQSTVPGAWPTGRLQIYNDGSTLLAWVPFQKPAFTNAVDGTATAVIVYDGTAIVDGTATWFAAYSCDQSAVWTGSVVRTGYVGDMHLNLVVFEQDQTVSISSAKYIVPA